MSKKILLVQFRTSTGPLENERNAITRAIGGLADVQVKSIFEFTSPEDLKSACADADGVIFGGSGDFDLDGGRTMNDPARATSRQILTKITPAIDMILERDIPFLGICYGHQLIAEHRGGCICNNKTQSKVGTHSVNLSEAGRIDPLFSSLPNRFDAQYGHKDSTCTIPKGATLIASSDKCRSAALRYGAHIYTTQFHPELTVEDVRFRMENSPGYLPEGASIDSLARPSEEASTLIPRFVSLIVK